MTLGVVESHYLKCPVCPGRAALDTHVCPGCGARAVAVQWDTPLVTPELVMVGRTDNMGLGGREIR